MHPVNLLRCPKPAVLLSKLESRARVKALWLNLKFSTFRCTSPKLVQCGLTRLLHERETMGVQRHDTPAGSLPRAKVYVEISPLSVGLKREHFRPLSAYPFRPPTSQTLTNSQLSQKQRAPLKKRKRPEKTPRSPNARSPPAKRKRKDISVVSFSVSRRDIGLESLGHEARDVLKPFHDYVVMDVSDVEETIEDRFLDATSLDAALRPMLRHLYAARGVSRRDTEYYGAAKHPSPSRRSQSPPTYASEPSSSRASGRFPTDLESLPFASCASSGITRTVSHDMSANPLGLADERLACARGQQLLAVRGLDAFLGVEDDSHEQEVYAHNHGPVAALPGLLPHEASEAVPWAHLNSFLDPQDSSLSPMTPYFGHGENVTSYTENGTINPSLLAPSGNTNQFRTPSPSPPPVSMSAVRSRSVSIVETTPYQTEGSDSDSDSDYIEDQRSKSRRAIEIGKERAYDAVRARETQSGLVEISELPGMVVGKRPRKPSAKAQEALHTTDQQDSRLSVSKTMIDHARSSSDAPSHEHARSEKSVGILQKVTPAAKQKKPKRIVGDGRYCHQCRNQNNYDKVQCSSIRADGLPCALLFCEKCILKRYVFISVLKIVGQRMTRVASSIQVLSYTIRFFRIGLYVSKVCRHM
ncbi:hypothetical protein BC835DRAFT_454566 [Cytidiella melzeri]|nr:hypothetical protein BC835DRAFT_454566 [Cytidiella melzeri]